jgi:hypothetical protein
MRGVRCGLGWSCGGVGSPYPNTEAHEGGEMHTRLMRGAVIAGVIAAAVVLGSGCPQGSGDIVIFPDKGLENAIRAELRQPFGFLTQGDLLRLTHLTGRDLGIRDLKGLDKAKNLLSLDLARNAIQDLTELTTLTKLRYLNLEDNDLRNIAPLAGLFLLEGLVLSNTGEGDYRNQIADIAALVLNAKHVEIAGGLGEGLGEGDYVKLDAASLGQVALQQDVPLLRNFYLVNVILIDTSGNPIQQN